MDATPARKLAELLETAPGEDRKAITAWLLERPVGDPVTAPIDPDIRTQFGVVPVGALHRLGQTVIASGQAEVWLGDQPAERLRGALTPGQDSQLVTLRLPAERHAQLRQWCSEHDFSMAAVIRGLVEQFLEARGGPAPDAG